MQIALTKKFSDASGIKCENFNEEINPLFCWTANWTNVWDKRKEDMLVLTNKASRFSVAYYPFKRKNFKNLREIIPAIIRETFERLNLNTSITEKYMSELEELVFVKNTDRKAAAHISKACLECALYVGNRINKRFDVENSAIGAFVSKCPVGYSSNINDYFFPYEKMFDMLSEYTKLPKYDFDAYELLVTLDLESYIAKRRIIVSGDCTFEELHDALQRAFGWKGYHGYEFRILSGNGREITVLTDCEEVTVFHENARYVKGKKLSEYLYGDRCIKYIYDFGDCWEHDIKLVGKTEHCNLQVPYLIEAEGKTPPEDVGGVGGYLEFLRIISDPKHPEHTYIKEWAGFWREELSEWERKPHVLE